MPEKKPPFPKPAKAQPKALKDEDAAIWDIATHDVKRMVQKTPPAPVSPPKTKTPVKVSKKANTRPIIMTGVIALETPQRQNHASSFQVDSALKKRFERGELSIDGKIDLHGLTLEQAHRRFMSFITGKIAAGARFLLVVTGKGAGGEGVIRKNLPLWCDAPDLKPHILQRTHAKPQHGGTGATYILLRKKKQD